MPSLMTVLVMLVITVPSIAGVYVGLYNAPSAVESRAMEAAEAFIETHNIQRTRLSCSGSQTDGYTKCIVGTNALPILLQCPTGVYLHRFHGLTRCKEEPYPRYPTIPQLSQEP